MSNKRKLVQEHELTPKHNTRLLTKRSKHESPQCIVDLSTPPSNCSTPKSQYSDDSLSQDYSPNVANDVGWDSKKRPAARKPRAKSSRFAEALAKEKLARNPLWRRPLMKKEESKPKDLSALEKFKIGIKKLESGESPKSSHFGENAKTFQKQKENVTQRFIFGESDDSDDEAYSSWNSMLKKFEDLKENHKQSSSSTTTPNTNSGHDESWRKTKSAQELKLKISEPLKDIFDDSISDSLLYQCTQQVEKKLQETPPSKIKSALPSNVTTADDALDNDSFDEMLSSFPLEEIVEKNTKSTSFARHNSMPCQSQITSIVEKVNSLVERHHSAQQKNKK
ncbi:uncharacterized protein LOC134834991 [Culicoides brevitarsis]|uniref:uncharacterized protein LOC134834991 n=1 Tax=Culicoides brevitarsis TaxID=469753 RepID=UPI00307BA4DD